MSITDPLALYCNNVLQSADENQNGATCYTHPQITVGEKVGGVDTNYQSMFNFEYKILNQICYPKSATKHNF